MRQLLTAGVLLLACAVCGIPLHGQAPQPTNQKPLAFEVASVKPNRTTNASRSFDLRGQQLTMINMPLRNLIWEAYGSLSIQLNSQILGGPSWVASDRFDITARTGGESFRWTPMVFRNARRPCCDIYWKSDST